MAGKRNNKTDATHIAELYQLGKRSIELCIALGFDPETKNVAYQPRYKLNDWETSVKAIPVDEKVSMLRDDFYDYLSASDHQTYMMSWGIEHMFLEPDNYLVLRVDDTTRLRYDFTLTPDGYNFSDSVVVEIEYVAKNVEAIVELEDVTDDKNVPNSTPESEMVDEAKASLEDSKEAKAPDESEPNTKAKKKRK